MEDINMETEQRGKNLLNDLKLLINNPRYCDVKLICGDNTDGQEPIYAVKALLAVRSEVLDSLLFNGMRETRESEIRFPEISLAAMKVTLAFLYTGEVQEGMITIDNAVGTYHAADYFILPVLKDTVISFVEKLCQKDKDCMIAARLLTEVSQKMGSL